MVNKLGFSNPILGKQPSVRMPETTGRMASRSTNIFASSGIFNSSPGAAETSGSCASSSGGGCGGSTIAIA